MRNTVFFSLLAFFILVIAFLNLLLNPAPPQYPSIGGGGYDLSGFIYTLCLLFFTCLWSVILLISSRFVKKPVTARRFFILAMIGALTFIASLLFYHDNLT